MKATYSSTSLEDTVHVAETLAQTLVGGELILLAGDLGAGKTAFTAGLAKGLGVQARIISPTFTIVNRYTSGRLPLTHFDLYRITDPEELFELGWEEFLSENGVVAVEWFSLAGEELPSSAILVKLLAIEEGVRQITVNTQARKGLDY